MSARRFLYLYLILLMSVTVLLMAFNAFVDPYSMFHSSRIPDFNEKKPASVNRSQLFKPYAVTVVEPRTLVVGNSRPEMGLDPLSVCWRKDHGIVYSLTFPGLSVYGQIRALFHGMAQQQVKHVVMGLDFSDVLYERRTGVKEVVWPMTDSDFFDRLSVDANFQKNNSYWIASIKDRMTALSSLNSLYDSLYTITAQAPNSPDRTPLGFNPARDYIEIIRYEGESVLFQQKMKELNSRFFHTGMTIFDTAQPWSIELEGLKRSIEYANEKNIEITFFINPYHYTYLETIRDAGYWKEFEEFKRSLRLLVDQYGLGRVNLWDFALYSSYTVSDVPTKDAKGKTSWFWEPAHYKAELGNIMLAEIFGKKCVEENHPPFGVLLNNIDLENHFKEQERQRMLLMKNLKTPRYSAGLEVVIRK